jgi:hypothetical protein
MLDKRGDHCCGQGVNRPILPVRPPKNILTALQKGSTGGNSNPLAGIQGFNPIDYS